MVIGIPSSRTIMEEEDIDLCKMSNSLPESTPIISVPPSSTEQTNSISDCPFEYLPAEELIEQALDLTDGCIYLTNYRLFILSNQSTLHCSFINYPVRLIDIIEVKDNISLSIQCKDNRSFRLLFVNPEKCCHWLRKLNESVCSVTNVEHAFAMKFASSQSNENYPTKREYLQDEFKRLKLNVSPWRTTKINHDYKLSPSYPNVSVVPESINDDDVLEVAKFRSHRRFPTVVWRHTNGAIIARTSQPEVGWLFWRSKEDEKMIQAIISACKTTSSKDPRACELNSNRLLILDARSYTAALANRAKGGGFEHPPYYTDCDVQFMSLPNIHVVRKSAQMLRAAIANTAQGENWFSQLESSRWLHNLSALIQCASFVVVTVDKHARPVLVHCSDGWDRTPQITTLAKIMLDSYYRTIEGFQTLIEREWIAFGHKFADRCGHGHGANDPNERSPVFLQWLDCIYQLFSQNPTAFEFNEMFLLKLATHTYTCLYGTFLCNTDCERNTVNLETRTLSIWSLLNIHSKQFLNHLFDKTNTEILYPSSSVRDLTIWSNLYLRDIRLTPAGPSEQTSTLISAPIPSYEDLSTSMTNNLHRSSSDPTLTNNLIRDLSLAIQSPSKSNSPSNQQQSHFGRLQNSTSTSSLFGQPHHLGTLNHSHQNVIHHSQTNQISIPISPNNRIKRQSLTGDDSSLDIPQLPLSYQRFSFNVNSTDNIVPITTQPRKHTTSTSSTTSSLSDTWSLTKINSPEIPHSQRAIQQHVTSSKILKLVRKRIDTDGLTKISDQIRSRMSQKERAADQKVEAIEEEIRKTEKVIYALMHISNNQMISPRMKEISPSSISSVESSSCSSWQQIDHTEAYVTRWIPDFNVQTCHLCHIKFHQWPISRKHHCRKCGNIFCNSCANYYQSIPALNSTQPVRVCRNCFPSPDENPTHESTKSAAPMAIQSGCRQTNGPFNSPGGQKVKG